MFSTSLWKIRENSIVTTIAILSRSVRIIFYSVHFYNYYKLHGKLNINWKAIQIIEWNDKIH